MASATLSAERIGGLQRLKHRFQHAGNWLYVVPALLFFIGYQIYPIIRVFIISFTDYHYLRQDPVQFIGFQNYINALGDSIVYEGLARALYFTVLFLPTCIFIPLFLAILVDRVKSPRLSNIYKF
jgi:multiple sugar transport system permease protein